LNYSKEEIRKIFEDEVKKMDFDLVDMQLNVTGKAGMIRLFVDRDGGININECSEVSRSISELIFRKDLFPRNYRLEVSSPGLDRPLTTKKDFQRNVGKDIILEYKVESDFKKIEGKIASADDELFIINDKNESFSVPFSNINNGKIKLPW